jgi:phospholipid/cholesterol/gamma-HCH transport system substrate-binding protein
MRRPFSRRTARNPNKPAPDPRIWGRKYTGPSPWIFGLIMVIVLAFASWIAFTKEIPFTSKGYELTATFENATTLRASSPVRIAGVNVGEVTGVESDGDAVQVTFTVDEDGQPVHDDAEATIRPRLFLEGNFFIDLSPGSPSAPELPDGGDIPLTQTFTAVQLDEVLTALQAPERKGLQRLLKGYGTALTYEPTPADDVGQDPIVEGESAAKSLNDAFKYGGDAGRGTAIVNTALLGNEPHDLSRLIRGFGVTFGKLADRERDLSSLITNFNVFTGALAAESANLSTTLAELAPTLEEAEPSLRHLNDALPAVRALAIESQPGIEELPATIAAADPWLTQTRLLLRGSELGGLAKLVRNASPGLAQTAANTRPTFQQQTALSRCTSKQLIPVGDQTITDRFSTGEPSYREFFYSTVNLAGESQGFDGNGPYVRFQSGGGANLVQGVNPGGIPGTGGQFPQGTSKNFANVQAPPQGVQPVLPDNPPPFRTDVACTKNPVPNLNGPSSAVGPPDLTPVTP